MNERTDRIGILASALSTDARDAANRAASLGFGGILFDAYSPALSIPELSQTGRREFRQVLRAQQIELIGLRGELGAKGFGPGADVDRLLYRINLALEAAAGLASPMFCLDLGPLPEPPRTTTPAPSISPEQAGMLIIPTTSTAPPPPTIPATPIDTPLQDAVNTALAELGALAERYSVTVALSSSLASFNALEAALLSARCPWFGIDLDPVAMLADEWNLDEIFSRVGSLIRHVRARDAILGGDRRTKPAAIGQGSVDWTGLISRLDHAGFRQWMTIVPMELPDRARGAAGGLAFFRDRAADH